MGIGASSCFNSRRVCVILTFVLLVGGAIGVTGTVLALRNYPDGAGTWALFLGLSLAAAAGGLAGFAYC